MIDFTNVTPALDPLQLALRKDSDSQCADYPPFCCDYIANLQGTGEDSSSSQQVYRLVYVLLCAFSIGGLIFISSMILYNKKLQSHPQLLIAYICIAEACMSWNALLEVINPISIICYLDMEYMFARSIFQSEKIQETEQLKQVTNTLCQSNQIFYCAFQLLSLLLNLCLCIDLILTIYNPFSPAANRLKWYVIGSFSATLIIILVIFVLERQTDVDYECFVNSPPGPFSSQ